MQVCGFCTIASSFFLIVIFFNLFVPVFSGETVHSELETSAFGTPADLPVFEAVPSSLSQFFGRKLPREETKINVTLFTEQYHKIEVYGITECKNSYGDPLI